MTEVSIVFGTYNRLDMLKACVESVQKSVGKLSYEIVVVDGGSTDGTKEWLIKQPDVVVVLDRRLEGAIKAFNKGFRIAQGKYVVNLNDDLLVLGGAIKTMYDYMEEHPLCGQGAFYFRLQDEKEFHVSTVFEKPYANFGMTRRELGDRLGWWGTDYHTYGGDTELSVKVWRAGLTVDGVKDAQVIDLLAHDELREINYKNRDSKGTHIDTKKFWAKWGRLGLTVNDLPKVDKIRVLHIALNTADDEQPALRRALEGIGEYHQIDWRQQRHRINDILLSEGARFDPHIVFMQLQAEGVINPLVLQRFAQKTDAFIVNWNGDVRPSVQHWMGYLGEVCDMTLITNRTQIPEYERLGCQRPGYLQIGFDDRNFKPKDAKKTREVVFLGTNYRDFPLSQMRVDMVEAVAQKYKLEVFGNGWPQHNARVGLQDEPDIYHSAKIALGISAFDYECYTSDRLFRAMGSGCFYLTKWFPDIETMFENHKHLVWWHDIDELLEQIGYYLTHDNKREKIAAAGCELVHKQHTWQNRIEELMCLVKSYSPILATDTTATKTTAV